MALCIENPTECMKTIGNNKLFNRGFRPIYNPQNQHIKQRIKLSSSMTIDLHKLVFSEIY
jgi:hypothetical protein